MYDAIDIGHNAYPDTGAVGFMKEDTGTNAIGNCLIQIMNARGGNAHCVSPLGQRFGNVTQSLAYRVNAANNDNATRFISIHIDSFPDPAPKGVSVYYTSQKGHDIAVPILRELVKLGYEDRGVKQTNNFYVLNHTNAPAVLVECGFVSNKEDCDRYEPAKIANAIAVGLGYTQTQPAPTPVESVPVDNGSFVLRSFQNACNLAGVTDENGSKLGEDGLIGPHTRCAIKKIYLRKGDGGTLVKWLQNRLISLGISCGIYKADGSFGNDTVNAVLTFQRRNYLDADGVVGPNTITKLLGL